jgi:hypothetical protein
MMSNNEHNTNSIMIGTQQLYVTKPPKPEPSRKPMTPKDRSDSYIELEGVLGPDAHLLSFLSGIAAAERYHKILGESDE